MPSANYVMKNWCVDMTWTPLPGTYATMTDTLTFKASANSSAYVLSMAQAQTVDMNAQNPIILGAPYMVADSDPRFRMT